MLVAAVFTGVFAYSVIDLSTSRTEVTEQMSELRAASTRRIDLLNQQLQAERAEGDAAEARASRYAQQLCDNNVVPFDRGDCK